MHSFPFHIGEDQFSREGEKLASLAGRLAREAVDSHSSNGSRKLVAGSLPPVFGSYEPLKYNPSRVQDLLAPLVRGLAPHVDVWLGETLSLIAEGQAVIVATALTGKPVWISFTLDDNEDDSSDQLPRLRSGEPVVEAARWARTAGVQALLFNCSRPEVMNAAVSVTQKVFAEANPETSYPSPMIGVYANTFKPRASTQKANEGISEVRPELNSAAYLDFAQQWTASGASIIGGCCGIGSEEIRELALTLKTDDRKQQNGKPEELQ